MTVLIVWNFVALAAFDLDVLLASSFNAEVGCPLSADANQLLLLASYIILKQMGKTSVHL